MANSIFPTNFTSKATPVGADLIIIADSAASNASKKATLSSVISNVGTSLIDDTATSSTKVYSSTKVAALDATQDAALTA